MKTIARFAQPSLRGRGMRAFTLVELLVVVSIIGLLAAVLLPSLSSARSGTHRVVCANNLRQIATGWAIYAQQNGGALVPGRMAKIDGSTNTYYVGNGDQYRPRWYIQMGAAAGFHAYDHPSIDPADDNTKQVDNKLFLCPTRPDWTNNRNYTFGYNFQFMGNSRLKVIAGKAPPRRAFVNFPVRIDQIQMSATTVMAADNLGTAATFPEAARKPYNPTGQGNQLDELGNHGWSLDPPRLTASGDFCDDNNRGVARSGPDPRHQGKTNFVYCDTHVEAQEPREVGYMTRDDGAYGMPGDPFNDEHSHNRFFSGTGMDVDPPSIIASP